MYLFDFISEHTNIDNLVQVSLRVFWIVYLEKSIFSEWLSDFKLKHKIDCIMQFLLI